MGSLYRLTERLWLDRRGCEVVRNSNTPKCYLQEGDVCEMRCEKQPGVESLWEGESLLRRAPHLEVVPLPLMPKGHL